MIRVKEFFLHAFSVQNIATCLIKIYRIRLNSKKGTGIRRVHSW